MKCAGGGGIVVSETDTFASYPAKIRAIQTGTDTSDATAGAGDILSGKTAYVKGTKVTGTIASRGAGDLTASGATVSVPAGFYPSAAIKSVATAQQATPGISVSSGGLITASATQGAGYVAAGTKSATKQLTDPGLIPENIRKGVSLFGVEGSLEASKVYAGYHDVAAGGSEKLVFNCGFKPEKLLLVCAEAFTSIPDYGYPKASYLISAAYDFSTEEFTAFCAQQSGTSSMTVTATTSTTTVFYPDPTRADDGEVTVSLYSAYATATRWGGPMYYVAIG